jgi:AbrB family looped-hinge helix DNA binding protein
MNVVTVSSKCQIVIPKELRERLGIEPGQKLQAFALEDRIELVPIQPLKSMRGFLSGIDTTVDREPDRE